MTYEVKWESWQEPPAAEFSPAQILRLEIYLWTLLRLSADSRVQCMDFNPLTLAKTFCE